MPDLRDFRCRVCYRLWLSDYGNLVDNFCPTCDKKAHHRIIDGILENEARILAIEEGYVEFFRQRKAA